MVKVGKSFLRLLLFFSSPFLLYPLSFSLVVTGQRLSNT